MLPANPLRIQPPTFTVNRYAEAHLRKNDPAFEGSEILKDSAFLKKTVSAQPVCPVCGRRLF